MTESNESEISIKERLPATVTVLTWHNHSKRHCHCWQCSKLQMLPAASVGNALLEQNSVVFTLFYHSAVHIIGEWGFLPTLHDTLPTSPKAARRRRCGRQLITQYLCVTEQSSWLSRCDMSLLSTFQVNTQYYALKAGGSFDKDAIPLALLTEEEGTKKIS